jgi:hypothetical protein
MSLCDSRQYVCGIKVIQRYPDESRFDHPPHGHEFEDVNVVHHHWMLTSSRPINMLSKRLTALITPKSPGVNMKGLPTISVAGDEVTLDCYFHVLELAEQGLQADQITKTIIGSIEKDTIDKHIKRAKMVEHILLNHKLAHGTIRSTNTPHPRAASVAGHIKPSRPAMPRSIRRVTTHVSMSDSALPSLTSPKTGEEKLVVETLKLLAQRDAMDHKVSATQGGRRATAALEEQIRESLLKHQAVDDAETIAEFNRQNLS